MGAAVPRMPEEFAAVPHIPAVRIQVGELVAPRIPVEPAALPEARQARRLPAAATRAADKPGRAEAQRRIPAVGRDKPEAVDIRAGEERQGQAVRLWCRRNRRIGSQDLAACRILNKIYPWFFTPFMTASFSIITIALS